MKLEVKNMNANKTKRKIAFPENPPVFSILKNSGPTAESGLNIEISASGNALNLLDSNAIGYFLTVSENLKIE